MRCTRSRSSVIDAVLEELVVREVVDCLCGVSDSHELSRELVRSSNADDVVRKVVGLQAVGIKPHLHIVDTRTSLWKLHSVEDISRSGVDVASDIDLIESLVAFLAHLDFEYLREITSDIHSTESVCLSLHERLVPSEVTWRKIH